jgi:hypothetical protein
MDPAKILTDRVSQQELFKISIWKGWHRRKEAADCQEQTVLDALD